MFSRITKNIKHNILPYRNIAHIPERSYDINEAIKQRSFIPQVWASKFNSEAFRKTIEQHKLNKTASITYGCTDPCAMAHMIHYLDSIYVSGWQAASLSASDQIVGPDFADYPHNTVPDLVKRLHRSQEFHLNRKNIKKVVPIIADADTGHGGITSTMRMTRNFIEAGVAGIHIEDQKHGVKKCGHMGGKVLCSTREQINRLNAARFQADIMDVPLNIISRSDAVDAKYIDTDSDIRDHKYIIGKCQDGQERTLTDEIKRFSNFEMNKKLESLVSFDEMREFALINGINSVQKWDHNHPDIRSSEGFFKIKGCNDFAIQRTISFAKYADSVWIETSMPCIKQAELFSTKIKEAYPDIYLSYNNSPSFNWDLVLNDNDLSTWTNDLAKLGYSWQFITLAGIHNIAIQNNLFSKSFTKEGMLAYVRDIQRNEKKHNMDMLKHQTWAGVNESEYIQEIITGSTDTSSTGQESTENQF